MRFVEDVRHFADEFVTGDWVAAGVGGDGRKGDFGVERATARGS